MRFCDECGTFLKASVWGLVCPRCGKEFPVEEIEVRRATSDRAEPVYVVENAGGSSSVVSQTCPRCGNNEAYRAILTTQGEHAGVKQDRTVERYTCTECNHTWTRN
jgi:DNA-directed RNA polymerase subunit M/transcription elongation factor TFIIS